MSRPPLRGSNGMGALAGWDDLETALPQITATMRRYLTQIACTLRPGSVKGSDLGLRCFATFLAERHREIDTVAAVRRDHIEDYKPWLATRPGQKVPRLTPNTIAHRLGNLRMFFIRIDEWGPHRPNRKPAPRRRPRRPRPAVHLAPDRPATQHQPRYRGPPLPERA